ncbi:MAG: ATP-dependent DNA helicase RecG [Deltaproteobacteria bacterium]|nr:MAG: ATP-dependent DNA helicase RecG [Deltaproteobacteria bacterium]
MDNRVRTSSYPIQYVKGVGPRMAGLLAQKQIESVEDLLLYYPYRYLDQRNLLKIKELVPGQQQVTVGKIAACGVAYAGKRRIFEILLVDSTGAMSLKWFGFYQKQMMAMYKKGMVVIVSGTVTEFRKKIQMIHPIVQVIEDVSADDEVKPEEDIEPTLKAPGIVPVYSQVAGIGTRSLRRIIARLLEPFVSLVPDPIPEDIRVKLNLIPKNEALLEVHHPSPETSAEDLEKFRTPAFRREIFEEFFLMEMGLALKRRSVKREAGTSIQVASENVDAWKQGLPFQLTGAQCRVLEEIFADIAQPHPMNRLIQGDVGSGKTVVAFLTALAAIENGFQVALMAPTEILAEQHYLNARKILGSFKLPMALLTSRLTPDEKRRAQARIKKGLFPLVIGTHALIAEKVSFPNLGMVIIDEQHRFGVLQRAALKEKGNHPHVLVMTATPIPRTLSMTIYGDLDLSVIDELPPGRQKIQTKIIGEKQRRGLYQFLKTRIEAGEQAYVVYPLVEESEKLDLKDATQMSEEIQRFLPEFRIGLLHGRTPPEEKETIMRSFKAGDIHLLVSTTVIEVGIDVPNATVMVIEHAERFGLSQLHQLRGRVGRGHQASYCLLMTPVGKTAPAYQRLQVMVETEDGFKIAEEDLRLRGPGDFLGTRQSGLPDLRIANLIRDYSILKEARKEAFAWIEKDPHLMMHPPLLDVLKRRWKEKLALADVG